MRPCLLALAFLLTHPLRGEEILVFAAASLTDSLRELGQAFEASTGHKVVFSFGASSDLARQIRAGAPADVFFCADTARMDELETAGLVHAPDRIDVLSNTLVIVVPAASTLRLAAPWELTAVRRLALADPESVPAGVYARSYLESVRIWEALRPRVVPTLDVRAALAAAEAEAVDAAIVYKTDAILKRRVRIAYEVPREAGPQIVYPVAPLAQSTKAAGRDLTRFLASPAALQVYTRYGFIVLPHPP